MTSKKTVTFEFEVSVDQAIGPLGQFSNALGKVRQTIAPTDRDIDELRRSVATFGAESKKTTSNISAQAAALRTLQREATIGSRTYQQLGRDAQLLERRLERLNKQQGMGSGRGQFALGQTVGAIAGAGIYGGPVGLIGATVGGIFGGGPGGALAGGAIGAQVGVFQQAGAGAATYAAELAKLRIALRGVTEESGTYEQSLEVVNRLTNDFNIPQQEAIRGFTQLSASVIGAGGNTRDAEVAFRAITAAIKATGGSAADVNGALLATSQVFSKGKVSAEELRGQIGERLPGAYAKFAEATGRSAAQLSKDLEDGKVDLNDFMKFVIAIGAESEATALKISRSSEDAGARLTVQLNELREELGKLLQPLGAEAQEALADLAEEALGLIDSGKRAVKEWEPVLQVFINLKKAMDGVPNLLSGIQLAAARISPALTPVLLQVQAILRLRDLLGGPGAPERAPSSGMGDLRGTGKGEDYWVPGVGLFDGKTGALKQGTYVPSTFPTTAPDDKEKSAKSAADKAARDAERLAAEQRRLNELRATQAIRLAEVVYERERELAKKLHDYRIQLLEGAADNRVANLPENQRAAASDMLELVKTLGNLSDEFKDLREAIADQRKKIEFEKQRAEASAVYGEVGPSIAGGSAVGRYRQGGYGPRGPNQYGDHFDIARVDGGYFNRSALDRFVEVNGSRLSSGLTVPGGQFGASRDGGARVHRAWDYAFGQGATLGLTGGAKWTGSSRGSYGDNAVFMTPDGTAYRIIHGTFDQAGRSQPGVAAGLGRNVRDMGDVRVAEAELKAMEGRLKALTALSPQGDANALEAFLIKRTRPLQDRADALAFENQQLAERNRLELEGFTPEMADFEMRRNEILRERQGIQVALAEQEQALLDLAKARGLGTEALTAITNAFNSAESKTIGIYDQIIAKEGELVKAREAQRIALLKNPVAPIRDELKNLREQALELANYGNQAVRVANAIGDSFGNAFSSVVSGSASVNDALFQLFTDIARNFAEMAAEILANQLKMFLLNNLVRLFGGGGGAVGGGGLPGFAMSGSLLASAKGNAFTANGVVPFARGGVVDSPTFMNYGPGGMKAGVVGEAGPEAILPLKRRSDGRLGVMMERPAPMRSSGRPYEDRPIRLETSVINGVEYATVDQVREATDRARRQGAEQGRASAFSGLQRSVGVRRKLGLNG